MRQFKLVLATLAATVIAGCGGGGGSSDQPKRVKFSTLVSFGDSLSDIKCQVAHVAGVAIGDCHPLSDPPHCLAARVGRIVRIFALVSN